MSDNRFLMHREISEVVRPGPGQYIAEEGALGQLDQLLEPFNNPIVISSEKALMAFRKHYQGKLDLQALLIDSSVSKEDIQRLMTEVADADVILGIGGGKVNDTAKAVADDLRIESIMIPTVLGTCAPFTPLSIIYEQDTGNYVGIKYMRQSPYACLLDYTLLLDSPLNLLKSGIGDSLAKYYEARPLIESMGSEVPLLVQIGFQNAEIIKDLIYSQGGQSIEDFKRGAVSSAFKNIAHAIVAAAGTVGGYAGSKGRTSGAHAIHDGMASVAETRSFPHGVKVAYGILVQLAVEKKYKEIEELKLFYEQNDFLTKLSDFNIKENKDEKIAVIASVAASDNTSFIGAFPDITTEAIIQAIHYLENDA